MTTAFALRPLLTVEEYRARERRSDVRHEYVDGRAYAMSGESLDHNMIAGNIYARLREARRGSSCRVSFESVRLVVTSEREYYPDVMVACGPRSPDSYVETAPCVLVEVLSLSTRRTDRREKGAAYRALDSLEAYVIVHQPERRVEWYARDPNDRSWRVADLVGRGAITFPCPPGADGVSVTMTFDEIYEGVAPPPARAARRGGTPG
ncbi:hypothetical protein tb265_17020 [Gemmatimonadetes bacterium T265]|nr:hypothetical protein tb265_17020 [Gemmatimonadetes bacterium T265]